MTLRLFDHFTYKKLIRYVIPSIAMMIFTSIYGVVDGLFISNFAGKEAFAAINLIMPFIMGIGTTGFMLGTGGSALVSKTLGEGEKEKANKYFSMIIITAIISGIILTVLGMIFLRKIAILMGASAALLDACVLYGRILLLFMVPYILQYVFQSFFAVAEKPQLGLYMTIVAGVSNMLLDALFVAVFKWGISGAAIATGISQVIGGFVPLFYFLMPNKSTLRLTKTKFYGKALLKTCTNGSSELMTNLSLSIVSVLYNFRLIKLIGDNGVAAYGVIMYVNFIFNAIFIGYSIGITPIIGYHFGAKNHSELKNLFKKSLVIMAVFGIILTAAAVLSSGFISKLFVGYDAQLYELTTRAFKIYALSFIVCGFNIFASAFFTALNDGIISATISFLRTLLFQSVVVIVLPIVLGLDGIWFAVAVAELMALVVTVIFFVVKRKKYNY